MRLSELPLGQRRRIRRYGIQIRCPYCNKLRLKPIQRDGDDFTCGNCGWMGVVDVTNCPRIAYWLNRREGDT